MMKFFLIVSLVLVICKAQWGPGENDVPGPPTVLEVTNQIDGLMVHWEAHSFQPIISQTILYSDSHGRQEQLTLYDGKKRTLLLPYVRPCETYGVQISIENAFGSSLLSEKLYGNSTSTAQPNTPLSLIIGPDVEGHKLRWEPPNRTPPYSRYVIIGRQVESDETIEQFVQSDRAEAPLSKLPLTQDYEVVMVTENSCGRSAESGYVQAEKIDVPKMPTILQVTSQTDSITIYPRANVDPGRVDYYEVMYTTPVVDVSYRMRNLPEKIDFIKFIEECFNHSFYLVAVNPAGQSEPAVENAMTLSDSVPGTPTEVQLKEENEEFILTWTVDSSLPVLNHRIDYQDRSGSRFQEWSTGDVLSVKMHHMRKCNDYGIQVRSENECGWSTASESLSVQYPPYDPPQKPTGLRMHSYSNPVVISWDAAATYEEIVQYDILVISPTGDLRNYWAPPSANQFTFDEFATEQKYDVFIRAENHCGWSRAGDLTVQI